MYMYVHMCSPAGQYYSFQILKLSVEASCSDALPNKDRRVDQHLP